MQIQKPKISGHLSGPAQQEALLPGDQSGPTDKMPSDIVTYRLIWPREGFSEKTEENKLYFSTVLLFCKITDYFVILEYLSDILVCSKI